MRFNLFLFSFLPFFFCCSASSQEIKQEKGTCKVTKSIALNQDSIQWSYHGLGFRILDNTTNFVSLANWDSKSWVLYDEKGNPTKNYGKKAFKNAFELPENHFPIGHQTQGDSIYLLYPTKQIFVCVKDKIIRKIKLQLSETQEIFSTTSFYFIPSTQEFVLSIGTETDSYKKIFTQNKPISFFDKNGKFLRSIGEYPKEYSIGNFFRSGLYVFRTLIENDKIYIMYTMFPTIYEYDLKGNLLRSFGQKSNDMNYKIIYNNQIDDITNKTKFNDYYTGFAKVPNEDVFYYIFFVNHKHKVGGKYYIAKYDIKNKKYIESTHDTKGSIFPLPKADKDGVYILDSSFQKEDIFINKCTITE